MDNCRPSIFAWGDASIAWIAELREPWLNSVMRVISSLGKEGAVLFILALAYWFWNKRHAKTLTLGMFSALILNLWIKSLVMECRPPHQFHLQEVHDYSFPSGHAQVCMLVWGGFAYYLRSRWLSPLCLLIGLLIAFSRPYLGVHYPQDVIAGLLLGLGVLIICILFEKKNWAPLGRFPLIGQAFILLLFLSILPFIIADPRGLTQIAVGGLFGFWLGYQWEERTVHYVPNRSLLPMSINACIGIIGILVLWQGLTVSHYLQYGLLSLWIAYGAPVIFNLTNKYLRS